VTKETLAPNMTAKEGVAGKIENVVLSEDVAEICVMSRIKGAIA